MTDLLRLNVDFSDYHLVFPVVIGVLLAVLLVIIGLRWTVRRVRYGPVSPEQRFRFFQQGFDWKKLFGAIACIVAYVALLNPLGFLLSSILFVVAVSVVFRPTTSARGLIGIGASALCTPLAIWLVFGQLFDITLP